MTKFPRFRSISRAGFSTPHWRVKNNRKHENEKKKMKWKRFVFLLLQTKQQKKIEKGQDKKGRGKRSKERKQETRWKNRDREIKLRVFVLFFSFLLPSITTIKLNSQPWNGKQLPQHARSFSPSFHSRRATEERWAMILTPAALGINLNQKEAKLWAVSCCSVWLCQIGQGERWQEQLIA